MICKKKHAKRFWNKVEKTDSCWNWKAGKFDSGYGAFKIYGQNQMAHRISYYLSVGEIPSDLQLDHLCRNRACVNPDHLEIVTCRENILRGAGIAAANARKTHCNQGHKLSGENLYIRPGGNRECRVCRRIKDRARKG